MARKVVVEKFWVPGIMHKLSVRIVSQKWLGREVEDPECVAAYIHEDAVIYISREATPQVREHNFYHEISHHIKDTLSDHEDNEEHWCDLLAKYLIDLVEQKEFIKQKLNSKSV